VERCFWLPISAVEGRVSVSLRLRPAGNGQ
jgi:hypothetical protein